MRVVEYLQSLLGSLGISPDKFPLVVGLLATAVAAFYIRPFLARVGRIIESVFLSNWQLGLLGTTGVVLSLASGWTTWDGMKNFTGEPILSAMVTFGIQGVMLIVAWLIGESFATGMNQRAPKRDGLAADWANGSLQFPAGLVLFGILIAGIGAFVLLVRGDRGLDPSALARWLTFVGAAIMLSGLLIVAGRAPTFSGYFDAMRVIVRSSVLWVMFLSCMATSVFFSFDSLFSTIFPQSERVRAAELRAQNQVAGITADIGQTIRRGLIRESDELFQTKGWNEYDKNLTQLAKAAQDSQGAIEAYFIQQAENRKAAKQKQQERIATSQSGQAGMSAKQISMREELGRLEGERPGMVAAFNEKKGVLEEKQRSLDAKRVEAMAEERGVEGTGKVGQGPQYRARKAEEGRAQDEIKIATERLKDTERPLRAAEARIATIKRELAAIDGDMAKLKAEVQTAEQLIKLSDDTAGQDEGPKVDPSRILPAFEKLRGEFRQAPKAEGLSQIQQMCVQMTGAMLATPVTKDKVRGIDCDPKTATEASARVFALNAGVVTFEQNCAGGDKLAAYKSADDLFGFARKCVQDSGLGSKDTDDLRQKINFIELNRDDKANRFVVTWNAFSDGNRLAYLSLAIAIAVDALVFMSGLFGANAVRSPLSDVPTTKARSAEQLEGIIDNALLPHKFDNARIAIEAMHADTSVPGYSAMVDLDELDPQSDVTVRRVLNAGATIGAVLRNPSNPRQYAIRPELFEYLSITGARAFEKNGKLVKEDIAEKVRQGELEKMVRVALLPNVHASAEAVMSYAHPMNASDDGFMSEILMHEVAPDHMLAVRGVLNAGAAHNAVRRMQGEQGRYELHGDLYKTLAKIRARMLLGASGGALAIGQQGVREGGLLTTAPPQIAAPDASRREQGAQGRATLERMVQERVQPASAPQPVAKSYPAFDHNLCEHFASEMLTFNTDQLAYVRDQSASIDVTTLQLALDNIMRFDMPIRKALLDARQALEDSIEAGRGSFDGFASGPADAAHRLNDFANTLKNLTALMVLMPGQAYSNILMKREAGLADQEAAMRLDAPEAQFASLLRNHMDELNSAPQSPDHWGTVQQSLNAFGRGVAALASNADQMRPARG